MSTETVQNNPTDNMKQQMEKAIQNRSKEIQEKIKNKWDNFQNDNLKINFAQMILILQNSTEFEAILDSPLFDHFLTQYGKHPWTTFNKDEKLTSIGEYGANTEHILRNPILQTLKNFEAFLCLTMFHRELQEKLYAKVNSNEITPTTEQVKFLDENSFDYLKFQAEEANKKDISIKEKLLTDAFNNFLAGSIQKNIKGMNNPDLNIYLEPSLDKFVETYKKNNNLMNNIDNTSKNKSSDSNQNTQKTTASQTNAKSIPTDLVKAFLEDLFKAGNLKYTSTGNSYKVTGAGKIPFTCDIDKNGKLSVGTAKYDKEALEKMIEILAKKIEQHKEDRKVSLSGSDEAIKTMKAACVKHKLEVVPASQQTQTKNPNSTPKTTVKIPVEDKTPDSNTITTRPRK